MMYRIFLILLSFSTYGQLSNEKISTKDFNRDGIIDTLKSGSGYVQVINGKTKEKHELSDYGCFCDIKELVYIPSELGKTENKPFLEVMKKELLPTKRSNPDASLAWMINGAFSNSKLKNNSIFNTIYDPQVPWNTTKYKNIDNYYIEIKGDTLKKLAPFYSNAEQVDGNAKGFLVYYAHNHYRNKSGDSITFIDKNELYTISRTSHGVIVEKDNLYKWLFISDYPLTGGPEKLRWESIKNVTLFDSYIVVEQSLPPDTLKQFFVINIETGICGLLKEDLIENNKYVHMLEDIFEELEKHYIKKENKTH
ncbi:hypothetical protein [uncultured Aquimarina sp.]|uniref:hypothetical protein n=1 Tax=uncultured Aquimarina sp. TaxID=575652 RepID=UPI002612AB0A|nr:hypothetical protein [uncultured Aquimarina sp.]